MAGKEEQRVRNIVKDDLKNEQIRLIEENNPAYYQQLEDTHKTAQSIDNLGSQLKSFSKNYYDENKAFLKDYMTKKEFTHKMLENKEDETDFNKKAQEVIEDKVKNHLMNNYKQGKDAPPLDDNMTNEIEDIMESDDFKKFVESPIRTRSGKIRDPIIKKEKKSEYDDI